MTNASKLINLKGPLLDQDNSISHKQRKDLDLSIKMAPIKKNCGINDLQSAKIKYKSKSFFSCLRFDVLEA